MGIQDYDATPANNTAIDGIDIAENCSPAGLNNAIRQMMADLATDVKPLLPTLNITTLTSKLRSTASSKTGYATNANNFAFDFGNGDIVGINGIFFNDVADGTTEAIFFKRTTGSGLAGYSAVFVDGGGVLKFAPMAGETLYNVMHEGVYGNDAMLTALKGDAAPTATDFDTATTTGVYSVADGTTNAPTGFGAWDGSLTVENVSGQTNQVLVINSSTILRRLNDGTSWSAWDRQWSDAYNNVPASQTRQVVDAGIFQQNTTVTVSHSLGVVPSMISVNAVCVIADQGYEVGDTIYGIDGGLQEAGRGVSVTRNTNETTRVFLRMGTNFDFRNEDTLATVSPTAFNRWRMQVVLWT